MNIYEVIYTNSYNKAEKSANVLARDAEDAVEQTHRFAKKNYSYNFEVLSLRKVLEVHIRYTTKAKKRK